ncbi:MULTISPECIES: hypothetical protein [Oceanobacillus]|uniref:Uncharacterized protein n=1 Tax=Oceanobacillus kimchii TaxID=746691 RepID=A0ABQ5TNT2_9BACI|nr:hypothetical protein [Oceanobacillus kimchii]GLO68469.1 hypothetical protein MACH08_42530 [Oceanobacillus kimchii]
MMDPLSYTDYAERLQLKLLESYRDKKKSLSEYQHITHTLYELCGNLDERSNKEL